MAYSDLIILAPCHGLEDFPLYHTGEDAASLLACWTALWHPLLIDAADKLPRVERCEYPPERLTDALLLLPKPCEMEMDAELPEKVEQQRGTLIRGLHRRSDILKRALAPFENAQVDSECVKDFFAFGFALLQVELLTQQMRYASSIDQTRIHSLVKDAARAAIEGDVARCHELLTRCHDTLTDERNHYYPVDLYFIDLTMLAPAPAVLGQALAQQLNEPIPQNLVASGETIEFIADQDPTLLSALRASVDGGNASVVGGEFRELPLPLVSTDSVIRQLVHGAQVYHRHLGRRVTTFARRKHGIYPSLVQVLTAAQFDSALHLKFDEGAIPESYQTKAVWKSGDEDEVDAVVRNALDASLHETFLNLPAQLSDAMDTDHVATRCFIHWPGHVTTWYHDLRRAARFGDALGRFITLQAYFEETGDSGARETFEADDYKYPFLQQHIFAGQSDPVSRWVRYWRGSVGATALRGLCHMQAVLGGSPNWPDVDSAERQLDLLAASSIQDPPCDRLVQAACGSLETLLCEPDEAAVTVVNPFSFARRVLVSTPGLATGDCVYASNEEGERGAITLVDVPPMGFATVRTDPAASGGVGGPNLIEELTLSNEFFQAKVDAETGGLRSFRSHDARKTQLSQQVALRITMPKTGQPWMDRQLPVGYTVMAADSVQVVCNGKILGEICAKGRLLAPNGEQLGEFVQRYRVIRGSRVLVLEVEVTPADSILLEDPWDSYYGCRFAFADETAVIRSGVQLRAQEVNKKRFEAPLFVDIEGHPARTTILTGGASYHRRISSTQLDTILLVPGEPPGRFRFGIGSGLANPTRAAMDMLSPEIPVISGRTRSGAASGWLFHIDARNVVVSWWQSLSDGSGVRLRLNETEGRRCRTRLRCCRDIQTAQRVNVYGDPTDEYDVEAGQLEVDIQPHRCLDLVVRW